MKKLVLLCSTILAFGVSACETSPKVETGGGLIDPAKSTAPDIECTEGDERCETGGGLIDPSISMEEDCGDDPRCETGGGLIDPAAEQ